MQEQMPYITSEDRFVATINEINAILHRRCILDNYQKASIWRIAGALYDLGFSPSRILRYVDEVIEVVKEYEDEQT